MGKKILIVLSFLLISPIVGAAQVNWYTPTGDTPLFISDTCTGSVTTPDDGTDLECTGSWTDCSEEGDYWVEFDLSEEGTHIRDCREESDPYTCTASEGPYPDGPLDAYGKLQIKAFTVDWDANQDDCVCRVGDDRAWMEGAIFDSSETEEARVPLYGGWFDYPEVPDIYETPTSGRPDTCDGDSETQYTCPDATDQICIDVFQTGTIPSQLDFFRSVECHAEAEIQDTYGENTPIDTDTCDGDSESRFTCQDRTEMFCMDVYETEGDPQPIKHYRNIECISTGTCFDTCPGSDNDNPYSCETEERSCIDCIDSGLTGREVTCRSDATTNASCCGDDPGENLIERIIGLDSPFELSDSDLGCCNSNNKCVLDSVCYPTGSAAGNTFNRSYCNEGVWQGGDAGEIQCAAISGAGRWGLEGDSTNGDCCGDDDETEFYNYQRGGSIDLQDYACCDEDTDCVYNNQCFDNGVRETIYDDVRFCIDGAWGEDLKPKCDWNGENCDYCAMTTDCITPEQECVPNGDFFGDHYCEYGNWTSRTKLVALQLFDIADRASALNFTLFCDSYENTFNYYDYIIEGTTDFVEDYFDEINNVCVLRLPNQVIFGTSLNVGIDQGEFIRALTHVGNCNDALHVEGRYRQCATGSSKAWYNNATMSIIYSNKDILDTPTDFEINAVQAFLRFLKNPFQMVFDFIFGLFEPDPMIVVGDYSFIQDTSDFSRIYFDRINARSIRGVTENVTSPNKGEYLSVTYATYKSDICSAVQRAYDNLNPLLGSLVFCHYEELQRTHYVVSNHTAALALWPDLTAKLRTRAQGSPPVEYCHIRSDCEADENAILSLSGETDAHISAGDDANFDYRLCCPNVFAPGSELDTEILRLSSETDAHVDIPAGDSQFNTNIYLRSSDSSDELSCSPVLYPGSCYPEEVCILSISDGYDGHVSECNENTRFKAKICCSTQGPDVQGGQIDGEQICTDSDGGLDYYLSGYVTTNQDSEQLWDSCPIFNPGFLLEHYCDSNGEVMTETYDCPNGCSDGACIQ